MPSPRPKPQQPVMWPRFVAMTGAGVVLTILVISFIMSVPEAVGREHNKRIDLDCIGLEPTGNNPALGSFPLQAPDLAAQDVTGKMVHLSAYRGRPVLVNFWASWCPPCREEMPSMEALQKAYPELTVMAISADESWADIRAYFDQGTSMTVLWDPSAGAGGGRTGSLSQSWGTSKLPESYLVDREGNIRYYIVNVRDWSGKEAKQCIERLLAE